MVHMFLIYKMQWKETNEGGNYVGAVDSTNELLPYAKNYQLNNEMSQSIYFMYQVCTVDSFKIKMKLIALI